MGGAALLVEPNADILDRVWAKAREIADVLRSHKEDTVSVVSHIDADGLTASAIAVAALEKAGIDYDVDFMKSVRPDLAQGLLDKNPDIAWFSDLGSGASSLLERVPKVVTDHHRIDPNGGTDFPHLNCQLFGLDGATAISGSGTTYLAASALGVGKELASVAVVGAVGDLQDTGAGRLEGLNRVLIDHGRETGTLGVRTDLRYFGRETRPVYKMLQYANDPLIPGVSGREDLAHKFLADLGFTPKTADGEWKSWSMLALAEKAEVVSAIGQVLLDKGFGARHVERLVGEVYVLSKEEPHTELRDAKEFATLLNSTARYGHPDIGLAVCLGDRGNALKKARSLLADHRRNLVEGLQLIADVGITERDWIQWFHAQDGIRDTIVGIVAGMALGKEGTRRDIPLVGFARTPDGEVKVSARAMRDLVDRGLDLAAAMREAASLVGGVGGGHRPAAGATIPTGKENEFLDALEAVVQKQLQR